MPVAKQPPSKSPPRSDKDSAKPAPSRRPPAPAVWMIAILMLLLLVVASRWVTGDRSKIDYTFFEAQLADRNVKSLDVYGRDAYGEFVKAPLATPSSTEPLSVDVKDQSEKKVKDTTAAQPRRLSKKFFVTLPSEDVDDAMLQKWKAAGV
jgi:hypothetical protein